MSYHDRSPRHYESGISPETRFIKGQDIAVAHNSLISPGVSNVSVLVSPQSIRLILDNAMNLENVHTSVRSRFAQCGIDMNGVLVDNILRRIQDDQALQNSTYPLEIETQIQNCANRPVFIGENTGISRFYYWDPRHAASGENLIQLVETGQIKIEGEQGVKWEYQYDDESLKHSPTGIFVKIDDRRRYIPEDPNNIPLSINGGNYREVIDGFLVPVPPSEEPLLWISETPKITLAPHIEGILSPSVFPQINDYSQGVSENYRHINSLLVDGGSEWPIRLEIKSPTTVRKVPNYALFRFAKAA